MVEKFKNANKASVLQILKKASSGYEKANMQMDYKIIEQNPMDDSFSLEITPDETASQVFPHLSRFKALEVNSTPSEEDSMRQVVKEVLVKKIFDLK